MKTGTNGSVNIANWVAAIVNGGSRELSAVTCFLYQFTDITGTVYYYTDGGFDCVAFGQTWISNQLQFQQFTYTTEVDSTSSNGQIVAQIGVDFYNANAVLNKWFFGFQQDLFEAQPVYVYRAVFANQLPPNLNQFMGGAIEYVGFVGPIKQTRTKITITLNDLLTFANVRLPKNLYQPGCTHVHYDTGCTLNKNLFSYAGSIGTIDPTLPQQVLHLANFGTGAAAGAYQLGVITFTSGLNIGLRRTIRADFIQEFVLMSPLPNIPQTGDTFTAYQGCDKTLNRCASYNNINNFRGFPFMPPETVFF